MRRVRRALAAAAAALTLAGCGVQPSGVIVGASPPSGGAGRPGGITLYLVSGGHVTPVRRAGLPLSPADTLALLAQGPTASERARGLSSQVPPGAAPFSVTAVPPGPIVVTPSIPADRLSTVAMDQIVCTVAAGGGEVTIAGAGRGPWACPVPG
ncbi:hypothetical protein [Amycolatopsis alkalitolerans]|uniref:GerMN domain-containing protein n=1 Tax=Amycolatopsis alkalitolerans TaxID=2547244 RepID=A0A5C4M1S6_9PSEU|nr:hypothetical protein [Amycolatopsis alkalitolerans]TNC25849.1 hypothetical protein FG385_14530 [Amycolatopsis alkalitolerans]